jgi:hypothetical protein
MEDYMTELAGGCLCGNIRYSSNAQPLSVIQCHCKNCQKQSGSAFSLNLVVKMEQIEINGNQLSCYKDKGDSGNPVYRYFCPNCGSALVSGNNDLSGIAVIKAGSLDDTSDISPRVSIWETSAQAWVPPCAGIPHFEQEMEKG